MACPSRDELQALGATPPADVLEHVQGCASCSHHLAALGLTPRSGDADRTGVVSPPLGLELGAEPTRSGPLGHQTPVLPSGTNLGRYVILDKLGEGGMGVVFVARDQELDRKVALKLLSVGGGLDTGASAQERQARLLREAQAMARLSHPNVVAVYDVLIVDAAAWAGTGERVVMVMELVEGTTLKAWLKEKPRRPREVLPVFDAAGHGLVAAHAKGITHRDFKPDNVLIGRDGRVRVADFGLAQQEERPPDGETSREISQRAEALTQAGRVVGTLGYMAPEQMAGARADARTDQFSFAVALYEALTGVKPFGGTTLTERIERARAGALQPPPEGVELPSWVLRILTRALSAAPEGRFPSMEALLAALRKDPARAWRRALAGAAVLSALAATGLTVSRLERQKSQVCTGEERRLAGVWDAAVRAKVVQAIRATGHVAAEDAATRVNRKLTAYTEEWVTASHGACEATRVRGTLSEQNLDLAMACLQEGLAQVSAIASAFAAPDAKLVARAPEVLSTLPDLRSCADLKYLHARVKPHPDPAVRAKVDQVRAKLANEQVLKRAGRMKEALAVGQEALQEAKGIGYPSIEARALSAVAATHKALNDRTAALTEARQVALIAASAGDDVTVVDAARLMGNLYSVAGQIETGEHWARYALALLPRTSANPGQRGAAHFALGELLFLKGDSAGAIEQIEIAEKLSRELPEDSVARLEARQSLAAAYMNGGNFKKALEMNESVLAAARKALPPSHPTVRATVQSMGVAWLSQGNFGEGRRLLLEAAALPGDVGMSGYIQLALGAADEFEGVRAGAVQHYDAAAGHFTTAAGPDGMMTLVSQSKAAAARFLVGERRRALADLLVLKEKVGPVPGKLPVAWLEAYTALVSTYAEAGDFEKALPLARALVEHVGKSGRQDRVAAVQTLLGRVLLEKKDAAGALKLLTVAVASLEADNGPSHYSLTSPLTLLGRARLASGDVEGAVATLQRAVALWAERKGVWRERADAQLALAQALEKRGEDGRKLRQAAAEERARLEQQGL